MLRFGVNGDQNDVAGFKVIDATVTGPFSFLDVTVLETYLEDGQADARHLVAGKLTRQQMIYEWLNIGADGTVFLGKRTQVALEFQGKRYDDVLTGHQCPSTVPKQEEYSLPAPPSYPSEYFQ